MISFIVIGKNEEKHLKSCFESIFKVIEGCNLEENEIIYVDSNSIDNSLAIAKSVDINVTLKITQNESPAAGRNLGAKYAKGEYLFFIDGDMVLSESLCAKFFKKKKPLYDFLTGFFICVDEDSNKTIQYKPNKEVESTIDSNGCFIIKKEIWEELGGMDIAFKKPAYEDYDFFVRCRKKKYSLKRLNSPMAYHNLVPYINVSRMWKEVLSGEKIFSRAYFYRKNIFNRFALKLLLRHEYSFLSLLFCAALISIFSVEICIVLHIIVLIFRSTLKSKLLFLRWINYLFYYIFRDFFLLLALVLYWPSRKEYLYEEVK